MHKTAQKTHLNTTTTTSRATNHRRNREEQQTTTMLPPSMMKNSAQRKENPGQGRQIINPNASRNDLLQQLRLITSQIPGFPGQIVGASSSVVRPEVARSNVAISTTTAVVNNTSTSNPIDVDMAPSVPQSPPSKESQTELFPYILHGMLEDVEKIGKTQIVSWNADGKSFRIHDPDSFVSFILGKYFKTYVGGIASRLTQFRSDLKDWGFEDAVDGNGMGETFTHHCFQKGQANLCRYMRCGRKAAAPTRQQIINTTPTQPVSWISRFRNDFDLRYEPIENEH